MFTLKRNSVEAQFSELENWLAVVGYFLPRTEGEVKRFEKLYRDYNVKGSIDNLDFNSIWNDKDQFERSFSTGKNETYVPFKMAARGLNNLSSDITDKIKKNQELAIHDINLKKET